MGETSNKPKTLEQRIAAITETAKRRNLDFDICFVAARQEWTTNWGEGIVRSKLEDLLEVIEEDIRHYVPPPPDLPDEPEETIWKS